ncbi:LytR C-terminal domain-containing protein [Corynebacterium sp.]|uniref:LytR C-terminal domain-containing protein n=1 Tax=Corynebacterium sp. TaxID=1720 RepID=UPI002A90FF5F|nr:LytR C-terminal domain-containing protein [Corynebacterium sp.]MDY5784740.1 LytR C-terminal domain-containing protein [Corynebacterium sp.]
MNRDNTEPVDSYDNDGTDTFEAVDAEDYRGAHRADGDDYAYAAGTGAGSTAAAAGGIPKRGLGMVLIAVAAILLLWGVYALTQGPADQANNTAGSATTGVPTAASAAPSAAGQPGAVAPSAAPSAEAGTEAVAPADGAPEAPAPAPAPAGAPLTRETAEVLVYNNSPTPDLASRTADQLGRDYQVVNKSNDAAQMNLPEQTYGIFPQTTVFFDPAVPGSEQVAADVAQRVGGTPMPVTEVPQGASLPREATGNARTVTVVLAG